MSNHISLNSFQYELDVILDNDLEKLTEINSDMEVSSVKEFLEMHYAVHNEVRLGSFYNEALKTSALQDDIAYVLFEKKEDEADLKVFVGSDAEIIGRFHKGDEPAKEFTMGHEPDSDLFKTAVGVAKMWGKDLVANEHTFGVADARIESRKELGVNTFAEWLKPELEQYAVHFPSIKVDDVIKVLDDTDFYFHESMRNLITEGRFNKDILSTPEALMAEIHNVGKCLHELSHVASFEPVETAFNVDVEALSDYYADDLEDELKAAYPEPKKKPNLKP